KLNYFSALRVRWSCRHRQPQLGDFLVQQIDAPSHALDQAVGDPRIVLHQAEKLVLGDHHDGAGGAGDDAGTALLLGEYRHGAKDLVALHIAYFLPVDDGFRMPLDNDEDVVGFIALADQFLSLGKILEAGGGANLRLL